MLFLIGFRRWRADSFGGAAVVQREDPARFWEKIPRLGLQ